VRNAHVAGRICGRPGAGLRTILLGRAPIVVLFRPPPPGEHAVAAGILTISDIRSGDPTAYTLPQDNEPPLPLYDICTSDAAAGDTLLTFIVDVERSKIRWLVRFRFIRPDQKDDLSTIIAGLKCIGQPPSISRIR
jgi:hypothetical protein